MSHWKKRIGAIQFTQFSLIGAMNGILDLIILNGLLLAWPTRNAWYLFLYNTLAYSVAVFNSYIWNSRLTFRKDAHYSSREKLAFTLQAAVSLLISNGVFVFAAYSFGYSTFPTWIVQNASKGMSMALSSMASFFFMKYFVFRSHSRDS